MATFQDFEKKPVLQEGSEGGWFWNEAF